MNLLIEAVRELLEETNLSPWDFDADDLVENEELTQQILSAREAFEHMTVTPALAAKVMQDPLIQKFFQKKIIEIVDFISEFNPEGDL